MAHVEPTQPLQRKVGLFRSVPPAIFPPVLGLLGLVVAWSRAAVVFDFPILPVQVAAGAASLLFIFCAGSYLAKAALNPKVVPQDLSTLPGRTGLAAICVALMVESVLFVGLNTVLAKTTLFAASVLLFGIVLYVLPKRLRGTDPAGPVTPAMHLVFVGFIVVPLAAVPLDVAIQLMPWLIWYCIAASGFIMLKTLKQPIRGLGDPPLRPLHVIHLAPASFVATGFLLTGYTALSVIALIWASALAALFVWRIPWLTEGPFSGFWSAFTFPVTAYVGALLTGYQVFEVEALRYMGFFVLAAATFFIPIIAFRILRLWANGTLAVKTSAAVA